MFFTKFQMVNCEKFFEPDFHKIFGALMSQNMRFQCNSCNLRCIKAMFFFYKRWDGKFQKINLRKNFEISLAHALSFEKSKKNFF